MKPELAYIPVITHSKNFPDDLIVLSEKHTNDEYTRKCLEDGVNMVVSGQELGKGEGGEMKCRWSECGKSFVFLDELASHVATYHANSGPGGLFYCRWDGCSRGDRGFNARYKMLVHVRTHTNEKPHQCFQCSKSFSRAENLKIHARSHTGERPYVCPVPGCGKAYSNSSDRFKHTRTHSVHKPYVCKIPTCGKRYTDPSSLRKHLKTYRHFPPTLPLDENCPRTDLPDLHAMEMAARGDVDPLETTLRQGTAVSFALLRRWLKSDSMFRSLASSGRFGGRMSGYLEEQDIPLDLRVRK